MRRVITVSFALLALAALTGPAGATVWTDDQSLTAGGAGSVGYSFFTLDADSWTVVQTFTNSFDPVLYLFRDDGDLTVDDYIAVNDDGGAPSAYGWNNSRLDLNLVAGSYVAAVGDYYLSLNDAVLGINGNVGNLGVGSGPYTLEVNAYTATVTETAPVPEPGTMALLGTGLLGLAGCSRRRGRRA